MNLALISDIHGNLFALEAVLNAIQAQNINRIICLGDVAAFGPQPHEVLGRLQELNIPIVMGNTDEWLLDPKPHPYRDEDTHKVTAVEMWAAEQLSEADKTFIRSFQPTISQQLSNTVNLLCFHGSPRSNTEVIRAETAADKLTETLNGETATIMAGGHTHTQMLRRYRNALLINPGSVGLPWEYKPDSTDLKAPSWAEYAIILMDNSQTVITFHRVRYDIRPLIDVVYDCGMPHAKWWVQHWEPD